MKRKEACGCGDLPRELARPSFPLVSFPRSVTREPSSPGARARGCRDVLHTVHAARVRRDDERRLLHAAEYTGAGAHQETRPILFPAPLLIYDYGEEKV